MAERTVPKVKRATAEDIRIGAMIEKKEHKWMTEEEARRVAKDHLRENPQAYTPQASTSTSNVNIRIKQVKPKKPVPPPPPSNAPGWMPKNMRLFG